MNYKLAAQGTILHCYVPPAERDPEGLTAAHAHWMLNEIENTPMSDGKANRWLGWAQAILATHGLITLNQLKRINKACACDDMSCPQYNTPHEH